MGVVVAVTVMHVLLFVLNVSMVVVGGGHEYVGGTSGSGIVSSATDVLGIVVLCGLKGVGGVCEMYMMGAGGS